MENLFFLICWLILKVKVIEYLTHYVKFEMGTALFCLNYLSYFQQ